MTMMMMMMMMMMMIIIIIIIIIIRRQEGARLETSCLPRARELHVSFTPLRSFRRQVYISMLVRRLTCLYKRLQSPTGHPALTAIEHRPRKLERTESRVGLGQRKLSTLSSKQ